MYKDAQWQEIENKLRAQSRELPLNKESKSLHAMDN